MEKVYNPNKLLINKDNIRKNIANIRKYIGEEIKVMPIIKANAYGVGVKNIIPILKEEKIEDIGVATIQEAIEIRKIFSGQILILLQPMVKQINNIISNDITVNVCDVSFLEELNIQSKHHNKVSKIHIEIDTGMGRTGISTNETHEFINKVEKFENIEITGISTHLSSSGCDENYTFMQIEKFKNSINLIKQNKRIELDYIHAYASGGILKYPIEYANMVRIGIMIYGYYPNKFKNIELYPSLTLKSKISYIHYLNKGESVGYNRVFKANKDMRVGIIPMGFADAFMGLESNVGYVLVRERKARIIAICMDTMIIDITDIDNVNIDEDVILWDNKIITLEQWGSWTNTSNYEVLSILSNRIDRVVK